MPLVLPSFAGTAQPAGGGGAWNNDYSVAFDGTDDVMTIPQGAFDLGTGNWTFSFWFRPTGITSTSETIFMVKGTSGKYLAGFIQSGAFMLSDWNNTTLSYSTTLADNTWYHGAYIKNGSGSTDLHLYLNGAKVLEGYHPNTSNYGNDTATTLIGEVQSGLGYSFPFQGLIDEFAFWSSALSATDVTAIYNSGAPADISSLNPVGNWRMGDNDSGTGTTITDQGSGSNDGTLSGATFSPAVPPGYSTKALDFDGADDYVDCGGASTFSFTDGAGNDEPFSISAWVKLDSVNRARVVGKDDDTQETREYLFGTDGDNKFTMFLGTSTDNLYIRLGSASSTGTWYHWVATYDGSNSASGITLYVDGATPVTEDMSQGTYVGMPAGGGPLLIGMLGVNDSVLDGLADEVAIFDSELSASDVTAIYNSGVPADLTSLSPVGWWRMGEDATWDGTNWTIPDASTNSNAGTTANMAEASRVTDTP